MCLELGFLCCTFCSQKVISSSFPAIRHDTLYCGYRLTDSLTVFYRRNQERTKNTFPFKGQWRRLFLLFQWPFILTRSTYVLLRFTPFHASNILMYCYFIYLILFWLLNSGYFLRLMDFQNGWIRMKILSETTILSFRLIWSNSRGNRCEISV